VETFEFCAQTRIQYPNIVARGAVGGLGRIVSETLPELKRIVVVSDDRVASLHWERVAAGLREAARDAVTLVTFPHGEAGK
jgi:hypothetical protein